MKKPSLRNYENCATLGERCELFESVWMRHTDLERQVQKSIAVSGGNTVAASKKSLTATKESVTATKESVTATKESVTASVARQSITARLQDEWPRYARHDENPVTARLGRGSPCILIRCHRLPRSAFDMTQQALPSRAMPSSIFATSAVAKLSRRVDMSGSAA